MRKLRLSHLLLEKITPVQENAIEVLRTFREVFGKFRECDKVFHLRLLLSAATEYNHTELRTLLLSNIRYTSEDLLISSPSCDVMSSLQAETDNISSDCGEIVQLLMADDVVQNHHGIRKLLASGPETFKHEKCCRNPLVNIITLAKDCFFNTRHLALPEIIQLFINAGADVNDRNIDGLTPLNFLMSEVIELQTKDHDIAMAGNAMIVEVTRILLAAGSQTDDLVSGYGLDGPGLRQPLDHLTTIMSRPFFCSEISIESVRGFLYLLIADLFELLLSYGAKPRVWWFSKTCDVFFFRAGRIAKAYEWKASIPGFSESYDSALDSLNYVLDSLGNIFRCFWLAEPVIKDMYSLELKYRTEDEFADAFIDVAHYTVPCSERKTLSGRSTRLTQHVLNTLSTTQLNRLRRILTERIKSKKTELLKLDEEDDEDKDDEYIDAAEEYQRTCNALEWVEEVETPFSLKHLARHAVIRAMGHRILSGISTLSIPRELERYVLLKVD